MRDAAEQVGLAADGTEDASARCRSTARVGRSAQAQRRAFAGGSMPPPARNGSALAIVSVVALTLLGMGMAVHAREAAADEASERSHNAVEARNLVSGCANLEYVSSQEWICKTSLATLILPLSHSRNNQCDAL
ncbi:hypothetical protein [Methylorubrum sp. GM97]|uniref:hypothetical protein n=1 Tax=Methylorubrum sp. GM97 TaxID=2938232 RepID=UPI0021C2DC50|nr:hypothetical protein [Methylorubrum sp. GM97]